MAQHFTLYISVPEWLSIILYISVPEWLSIALYISVPEWLSITLYISVPEWLSITIHCKECYNPRALGFLNPVVSLTRRLLLLIGASVSEPPLVDSTDALSR